MTKIKVRIITASQLLPRELEFFCLDELSQYFDLEYWDCSAFLFPNFRVPDKEQQRPYLREISSLSELEMLMKQLPKNTVIVKDVFANQQNYKFHIVLCKYFPKHMTVYFSTNMERRKEKIHLLGEKREVNLISKVKEIIYKPFWVKRTVNYIRYHKNLDYQSIVDKLYASEIMRHTELTIIACLKGFDKRINHPDYERYLKIKDEERIVNGRYIVFIDEYYPYLKEVEMGNPNINLEKAASLYYESMNKFFDGVEKEYGCKVVVAAHPRSDYLKHNPFGGRELYYYKTANLIKDCEAVCIHNSNCYSFVALYDKPIVAMINKGWRMSSLFTKFVEEVNGNLSIPITDTDSTKSFRGLFTKLDPTVREKYIDTYLCETNNHSSNVELFIKYYTEYYNMLSASL